MQNMGQTQIFYKLGQLDLLDQEKCDPVDLNYSDDLTWLEPRYILHL